MDLPVHLSRHSARVSSASCVACWSRPSITPRRWPPDTASRLQPDSAAGAADLRPDHHQLRGLPLPRPESGDERRGDPALPSDSRRHRCRPPPAPLAVLLHPSVLTLFRRLLDRDPGSPGLPVDRGTARWGRLLRPHRRFFERSHPRAAAPTAAAPRAVLPAVEADLAVGDAEEVLGDRE